MKRVLLPTLVIVILLLSACGVEQVTIPQSAIDEIYAISQDEIVSRHIEVTRVEDKSGYCYIMIDIKYIPELITNLEDAFTQAEIYTNAVAQDTVKILNKHGIDEDVSVWAELPLGNNEVALLGNTWYDAELKSYKWNRYKGS